MPKKAYIVAAMINDKDELPKDGDYFGVDYGAYYLASKGYRMEYAVGDFDSVTKEELDIIKLNCNYFVQLPDCKDETDSEYAINIAFSNDYHEVVLLGVIGGRADHFYANLMMLQRYENRHISLLNSRNYIRLFTRGSVDIVKFSFKYLSIFALEPSSISIHDVKYPLDHFMLHVDSTVGTSNEILDKIATLQVHFGRVLVIQSNDKTEGRTLIK